MAESTSSRLGALALCAAALVVVATAGSAPVASKGVRRAKKPTLGMSSAAAATNVTPAPVGSTTGVQSATAAPSPSAATPPAPPTASKLQIGPGTRVLVFGDSFTAAGFQQRIKKLVEDRGAKLVADAWTSATTKSWATKDRLAKLLEAAKPDVVIIVLGANETFYPAPEVMAPHVKKIVSMVQPSPCAWVSPPLWKGETGIVSVMRNHSAPCAFFDSGALKMEKQPDGIHPSDKGGGQWADAFWEAHVAPAPTPVPAASSAPAAPALPTPAASAAATVAPTTAATATTATTTAKP